MRQGVKKFMRQLVGGGGGLHGDGNIAGFVLSKLGERYLLSVLRSGLRGMNEVHLK